MLKIRIIEKKSHVVKVLFQGHAMYDVFGKDIVCSAASSILITTVNGILSFDPSYIEVEEKKGLITLTILQDNEITSHLISNMIDLLRQLERDYPKNIMINKEG